MRACVYDFEEEIYGSVKFMAMRVLSPNVAQTKFILHFAEKTMRPTSFAANIKTEWGKKKQNGLGVKAVQKWLICATHWRDGERERNEALCLIENGVVYFLLFLSIFSLTRFEIALNVMTA